MSNSIADNCFNGYLPDFESVDDFDIRCISLSLSKQMMSSIWRADEQTSEPYLVAHRPAEMKGKRNAVHAVIRDLHYQFEPVGGENKHF